MMAVGLSGKPIVITGASSGIGRATALRCAHAGMPVVVNARRAEKLEEVAQEIEAAGGKAIAVAGDVTNKDDCVRTVEACVEAFGSVYSVFANAGYGYELPVDEQSDEQLRAIFETNFFGTMHIVNAAIPRMKAQKSGHILICSSSIGLMPIPYYSAYCATKSAQHHVGRALNLELSPWNIRSSTVHPIGTKTDFFDTVLEQSGEGAVRFDHAPKWTMQPPSKVAKAVVKCLKHQIGRAHV